MMLDMTAHPAQATHLRTTPELSVRAGPVTLPRAGRLCLEIDLRQHPFVSLDFRDAAQSCIPLHLSLRRDAGVIVANRWSPAGWRRELAFPAALRARVHDLHLHFDRQALRGPVVTIFLDGARVGQLDGQIHPDRAGRYGLRRGFAGLDRLRWMTWPDAVLGLRLIPDQPDAGPHLTRRLEIAWPGAQEGDVLDFGASDGPTPFLPLSAPVPKDMSTPRFAILPGRVWAAGPSGVLSKALGKAAIGAGIGPKGQGAETHLVLRSACGAPRAAITVQRARIVQMLHDPETLWQLEHDSFMQLQMLEHVHHAGLWRDIPDTVHAILARLSTRSGLQVFQPPCVPRNTQPAAPRPDPAGLITDAFHATITRQGGADAPGIFARLIAENQLSPDEIRKSALMLCEWFCLHAEPRELARVARDAGSAGWRRRGDAWGDIAALPLLYAQGHWAGVSEALHQYPRAGAGWVVTPALGWLASALAARRPNLHGHCPPPDRRMAMLSALLDLIAALAGGYQSQMGCVRIVDGMLDILQARPTLPDWAENRFTQQIVTAFALCPAFWAGLRARDEIARGPVLASFDAQFAALQAGINAADPAAVRASSRPFLDAGIAGHERLRRTLMTPPWLAQAEDGLPDLAALAAHMPRAELQEASLRWLAAPRSAAARAAIPLDPVHPVHKAACAGLTQAACDIPRPAYSSAGLHLGTRLQDMLRQLAAGQTVTPQAVAGMRDLAQGLRHPHSGDIGFAALLALTEALSSAGQDALASACLDAALHRPSEASHQQANLVRDLAVERFLGCCPDATLRDRLAAACPRNPACAPPAAPDPQVQALRARANPFSDTLVALISCRKHLPDRAPAIRAAWGDALARFGIPLITVVGRSPDQRQGRGPRLTGDLLELDAPDSYEGLPQKTLALVDWACNQTGFGRILKIDDDCFLNAEAFFTDPAYLGVPYHGRPLHRRRGDMDRGWHMARSATPRGRKEIDKSPEPSAYADGSTGYVLARPALNALRDARRTARGRVLEQVSFMEDKLVGDLLALGGITVAGPNHTVAVFRRAGPGLPPLPQYENGFLPFAGSPVKLAHLDSGGDPAQARAALAAPWPQQMKLFPCHTPARLGWAKNILDLVSPPDRLHAARSADLAVIAVMRNESFMLPHFLEHYRNLGVTAFLIADNGSDDGTLDYLCAQPDVAVFTTDTPYRQSCYGVIWQETLMAHYRMGRWSLLADADELAFWSLPDAQDRVAGDLPGLLSRPEFAQADAVRLYMLDLYPRGPLSETRFDTAPFAEARWLDRDPLRRVWCGRGPWSNSATVTSALRHRLMRQAGSPARENLFVAQKYALLRYHPMMQISAGLHYVSGARVAERALALGHFKYHAEFHAKAQAEALRGQHFNAAEEYVKYAALCDQGQDRLFDAAHSVELVRSEAVQALLAPPAQATGR